MLTTNELTAQSIGVALIITTIATPHPKKRSSVLLVILIANILSCAQFYFLDAKTGLFGLIVTTVRSVVYWAYSNKDRKAPLLVLIAFIAAQVAATFIGWVDWVSILTLCLVLNTYGQWQTDEKTLRVCLLASAVLLGIYCLFTHAYTGAVNKFLQAASTVIALYRTRATEDG